MSGYQTYNVPTEFKNSYATSSEGVFNSRRTTVFSQLSNKRLVSGNKNKSKMCKSIIDGTVCKFGNTCAFAHSESEIIRPTCLFGIACKTKGTTCKFDHSKDIVPPTVNEVAVNTIRLIDLVPVKCTDQEVYLAKSEFKIYIDDEESDETDEDEGSEKDNKIDDEEELAMLAVMNLQK